MMDNNGGHCRRAAIGRAVVLTVAGALLISMAARGASADKAKNALKSWSQEVLPANEDVACQAYAKRMGKYVETIAALRRQIDSSASGPPRTVLEMLQGLAGQAPENGQVAAAKKRLVRERKAAEELNHLIKVTNCEPIDIDQAIAGAAVQAKPPVAPQAPEKTDDIMKSPR